MAIDQTDPLLEEYTYPSLFGEAEVFTLQTEDGTPLRVLYVDGGFQSATYLGSRRFEAPFAYVRTLVDLARDCAPCHALLLGGGTFTLPKHLLTTHPDATIDVVEIDPVVVDIAHAHFFVDELETLVDGRLTSHVLDGAEFLAHCAPGSYTVIINDCFAGTTQDAPLLSPEALADSKRALAPGGIYLLNAVAETDEGEDDIAEITRTEAQLCETFAQVEHFAIEDDEFAGSTNHLFRCRG